MFTKKRNSTVLSVFIMVMVGSFSTAYALNHRSYFYNIYDSIIFSYEDEMDVEIYRGGQLRWSGQLDKGEHHLFQLPYGEPKRGVFEIRSSSRKISILTGDMASRGLSGYYAVGPYGQGISKELYTYVPVGSPDSHDIQKLVVFAYEDGTQTTIEYDQGNGDYQIVDANVPMDKGGHWESEDLSGKYIHVSADKPVSALSCYDTGYFVPSENGSFGGTRFYTYISKNHEGGLTYSPDDLIVMAYNNDTLVTIADCNTPGVVKWQGALYADEPHVQRFPDGLDEPVSVTSSQPVTVSVDEWVTDESDSVQRALFAPPVLGWSSGAPAPLTAGLGRDVLAPVHQKGYFDIVSHMDDTHVRIYNAETNLLYKTYNMSNGEFQRVSSVISSVNGLWRIVSNRPLSVYTGELYLNNTYCSAEFCPLFFDADKEDMVKVSVKSGLGDCTEPEDPNHCFEPTDPNNNKICYTLSYWSDPNDDTNVVITDYLPREMEFISADPNTGFYDPNNHTCRWDIGTVTGGDPCSYCYIKARLTKYAQPGQKITNKVQLSSHTSYYTDEVSTPVCCPPEPIIYVKADAQGFRNGSSWADAYTTIQPALTRARAGFGSEIWVAGGVYHPSKYITRTRLRLLDGVQMYGGFGGDETSRDQRDFIANKTYLSGDIDSQGDNDSFGVVYSGWGLDDSVLDGFVITKGDEWAGLYCYVFSMPTIRNCVIRKNRDHGIICTAASPRIYDCRIEENYGSGIYSANAPEVWLLAGRPLVKRCVIRENHIGLEYRDDGRPVITNSWIYNNIREGISLTDTEESVVIRDNTIVGNGRYGIKSNLPVDLSNCIVWGNNSNRGYIQLSGCSAIYSCITDPNDPEGEDPGADEPDEETGNISANPLFAYDDPNDYHLGPYSPCIDIGHDPNGDCTYYDNLDIDGNVRVYNGRVDMGADEYTCDDIYNDVDWNSDRIVDIGDLIILANAWLIDANDPDWDDNYTKYNLNTDNVINYGDFAVFGAEWLWEPCWTSSGTSAPMMMGMSGGIGRMAGAESQQSYREPTIEERIIAQLKEAPNWLKEVKTQADKDILLGIVACLEKMLKELEKD